MKNTIIQDADCQAEYCASLKQKFKDQREKNDKIVEGNSNDGNQQERNADLNVGISQNENLEQVENEDKETQMLSD